MICDSVGRWNIRVAKTEDLHALVKLEQACFSAPWSHKSFQAELEGNQFSQILIVPHLAGGQEDKILGYICTWIVFEELRFLNIAVHPNFRRQGVASQLIRHVLESGRGAGCCRAMLEVRESNHSAKKLYESFKFSSYATRKSYYTNPVEDAILMTLEPLSVRKVERRFSPQVV